MVHLDYWAAKLADLPALELPTDRARSAASGRGGGVRKLELPTTLVEPLRALGRQERATLFVTLLASFQVLLFRHTGQDSFAVGTPIAGRSRPELERLIG